MRQTDEEDGRMRERAGGGLPRKLARLLALSAILLAAMLPISPAEASGGEYTISGLPSGTYKVEFSRGAEGGNFVSRFFDEKPLAVEAVPVEVSAPNTTSGVDAALRAGGQIAGKVTAAAGGAPLEKIEVCASAPALSVEECAFTEASGEYTISGLASGTYSVDFISNEGGNFALQEQSPVSVSAPTTTPGIDAELQPGGQIGGRVSAAGEPAVPVANVEVCITEKAPNLNGCATTNENGEYVISSLATGEYKIVFHPPPTSNLVTQFYSAKASESTAEAVAVTAGALTPNIGAELQPGAQIAGTVSAAGEPASPVANVEVCAYEATNAAPVRCASTSSSGEYTIPGLAGGEYKVKFTPRESALYPSQYYSGRASAEEAEPVAVSVPETKVGIDAQLRAQAVTPLTLGGRISGTVIAANGGAPLAHIEVCAIDSGGLVAGCATTSAAGPSPTTTTPTSITIAPTAPAGPTPLAGPNSVFALAKTPVLNTKTGDLEFFYNVVNPGRFRWKLYFNNADVGFADGGGTRSKRCKPGTIKHKGRCVPILIPFAAGAKTGPAGVVELTVLTDAVALKALKAGRPLRVSGEFTFQSALGGAAVTHAVSGVVRWPKSLKKH